MSAFETSAIVGDHGVISVDGVPLPPGTEVAITIVPKTRSEEIASSPDEESLVAARKRMKELFGSVTGFRMGIKIPREELYERGHLR